MYGYKKIVKMDYQTAVQKTREELKKEGFGVITEIDVKDTLKKKLNAEFSNYIILGACNPPFAYQALQIDKDVGLMMPCNIVVYEDQGQILVGTSLPATLLNIFGNEKLKETAKKIENKLKKVVDNIT